MVGFSLAHDRALFLLLAPFLLAFWAAIALVGDFTNLVKKEGLIHRRGQRSVWQVLLFGLLFVQERLAKAVHPTNGLSPRAR